MSDFIVKECNDYEIVNNRVDLLNTGDLKIRDAQLEDAERLLEIYSYYVLNTAVSFEYDVPSLEEFKERIKNTKK